MSKEWVNIKGYDGKYQINKNGIVKSFKKNKNGKTLKSLDDGKGYLRVRLYRNKVGKYIKIHQLVAITFLNHEPCGMKLVVDHINCDKYDNRVENLQILNNRQNCSKEVNGSSKYTGVSWQKNAKKWQCGIMINGKRVHLGYFRDELEASEAYQNKLNSL